MKKAVRFWVAVFLALGAMISFTPRNGKAREALQENGASKNDVAQHFEATWKHVTNAVGKHG